MTDQQTRCRSCNAVVTWGTTDRGKRAPFDADGTSHFATCPDRRVWRKADVPHGWAQPSLFDDAEAPLKATTHRQHYD